MNPYAGIYSGLETRLVNISTDMEILSEEVVKLMRRTSEYVNILNESDEEVDKMLKNIRIIDSMIKDILDNVQISFRAIEKIKGFERA